MPAGLEFKNKINFDFDDCKYTMEKRNYYSLIKEYSFRNFSGVVWLRIRAMCVRERRSAASTLVTETTAATVDTRNVSGWGCLEKVGRIFLNSLMTNRLAHQYHFDESTVILRGIRSDFDFFFFKTDSVIIIGTGLLK